MAASIANGLRQTGLSLFDADDRRHKGMRVSRPVGLRTLLGQ